MLSLSKHLFLFLFPWDKSKIQGCDFLSYKSFTTVKHRTCFRFGQEMFLHALTPDLPNAAKPNAVASIERLICTCLIACLSVPLLRGVRCVLLLFFFCPETKEAKIQSGLSFLKSMEEFPHRDPSRSLLRAHSRFALLLPTRNSSLIFTEKYNKE